MRDIRGDLQDRASLLEERINAAQAQFENLIEELKREHRAKVEGLGAELEAVTRLMEGEYRRLNSAATAQEEPRRVAPPPEAPEVEHRRPAPAEADPHRRPPEPEAEHHRRPAPDPQQYRQPVAAEAEHRRSEAAEAGPQRRPAREPEPYRREPEPYRRPAPEAEPQRRPAPEAEPYRRSEAAEAEPQRRPAPEPEPQRRPAPEAEPYRRPEAAEAEPQRRPAPEPEPYRRPEAAEEERGPAAPQVYRRVPIATAPEAEQRRPPPPRAPQQPPLADFLIRRLSEIGAMTVDDLCHLAIQEGYFAEGEVADRGVHATLVNVAKAGFIRQLPNGTFAPATVMDTIRLRRAI
jgi:hypothetical protein